MRLTKDNGPEIVDWANGLIFFVADPFPHLMVEHDKGISGYCPVGGWVVKMPRDDSFSIHFQDDASFNARWVEFNPNRPVLF